MSYVQEVLQPGETIRFHTNIHWFVYLHAIGAFVLSLAFLAWYQYAGRSSWTLLAAAAVCSIAAIVVFVPAWLKRFGTEIAVTNRRIIYKTGLFQRHTIEINMEKVESVDVDQSIAGRLFGYGTITVRGTGEGIEPLRNIAAPLQLRNAVMVSER